MSTVPTHSTRRRHFIEFGDCDPAGIVYFPRYLEWFDAALQNHLRESGFPKARVIEQFGYVAFPVVDLKVTYSIPSTFHEEVVIETQVVEMRRSSFVTKHQLWRGDKVAVQAIETRVWATRAEGESQLRGTPIPEEIRRAMMAA
jgi:4-hydroxybenzoyl-CoA thioesterase